MLGIHILISIVMGNKRLSAAAPPDQGLLLLETGDSILIENSDRLAKN